MKHALLITLPALLMLTGCDNGPAYVNPCPKSEAYTAAVGFIEGKMKYPGSSKIPPQDGFKHLSGFGCEYTVGVAVEDANAFGALKRVNISMIMHKDESTGEWVLDNFLALNHDF